MCPGGPRYARAAMHYPTRWLAFVLGAAVPAQTVHQVGPGFLAEIRDALALAAPGDVIEVQPGLYAHFAVTVPVTIRAAVSGTVDVEYQAAYAPPSCLAISLCAAFQGPTQFLLAPGQTAHVIGLRFRPNVVPALVPNIYVRHRVAVQGGRATFDQCEFMADGISPLFVTDAAAHLQECVVAALGAQIGSYGVVTSNAQVTAVDSVFAGSSPTSGLSQAGSAILLQNSTLHASNALLLGGTAQPSGAGVAALEASGSSTAWIADSVLAGGPGACPTSGFGPGAGRFARTTLLPPTAGCTAPAAAPMVGVHRRSPIQNGASFTVDCRTDPNGLIVFFASPGLGTAFVPSLVEEPVWLDPSIFAAGVAVADAQGDASASWSMPPGAFVDTTLWLQAVSVTAFPLHGSPVFGGVIR